jgi:hypothetical protein
LVDTSPILAKAHPVGCLWKLQGSVNFRARPAGDSLVPAAASRKSRAMKDRLR